MEDTRCRAIFTNDAECDDMNSLVHLLLCTNDIDLEGIVLSSSIYHYAGSAESGIPPYRWAGGQWMWDYLDDYAKVYPNLLKHDPRYPAPADLRRVTCVGNVEMTGEMGHDTPGSNLIRDAILKEDSRPVYLLAGGGTNTIARALRSIEERYAESVRWDAVYAWVCRHAVIYMILTQDDTYRDYISRVWPDLPVLHCTCIRGIAFKFDEERDPATALPYLRGAWLKPNILNKGSLCGRYHTWFDGHVYQGEEARYQYGAYPELMGSTWHGLPAPQQYDMISEGDSPAFLHLIHRGLRSDEHPSWGGWGGRFVHNERGEFGRLPRYYQSANDDDLGRAGGDALQLSRWLADVMNDFACRAQWCVASRYEDGNHPPRVDVREGSEVSARPGECVALHAEGSDPDGDLLGYDWFRYHEVDRYRGGAALKARGQEAQIVVPPDAAPGDTIHVVVRVRDDLGRLGTPYMASYARVVITVR